MGNYCKIFDCACDKVEKNIGYKPACDLECDNCPECYTECKICKYRDTGYCHSYCPKN
jgi:hypothetical protein